MFHNVQFKEMPFFVCFLSKYVVQHIKLFGHIGKKSYLCSVKIKNITPIINNLNFKVMKNKELSIERKLSLVSKLVFKGYYTDALLRLYILPRRRKVHAFLIPCDARLYDFSKYEITPDLALSIMNLHKI